MTSESDARVGAVRCVGGTPGKRVHPFLWDLKRQACQPTARLGLCALQFVVGFALMRWVTSCQCGRRLQFRPDAENRNNDLGPVWSADSRLEPLSGRERWYQSVPENGWEDSDGYCFG